jgi:WD40 repeat protein/serine/threonine protein kinase/tetratricopeptide (TPR) repeat protein
MSAEFQRHYLQRLPLPLAQLYSRAHNGKDARGRHDNTFYLFEALVKLTASAAVAAYLDETDSGAGRVEGLDRLLAQLALPSLGQWLGMLRGLARHFGSRPDAAAHPLGHLHDQLERQRRDRPALLALYRRIKNGPDGEPVGDQSCSLIQVLEALVQYRNAVFGHGAGRWADFYEAEMGPLLFPAANEALAEGSLDPLGPRGSRLVYLTEVRLLDEARAEVGLRELVGLTGERMAPLEAEAAQARGLAPNRVGVLWPGRRLPLLLGPLLLYRESEVAADLLFLNRDRNGRQVEYLSYTTGRTERDRDTAPALAALLSRATGRAVGEAELHALAEQSFSQAPSVEALFAPAVPEARRLGDYEVLSELGRGGMGVVYLARQLSLGRLVALKMLPGDLSGDESALARFRREVEVLARCEHPNIVKVLSSGVLPDGRLFYTMEYVPGCNLEQVWRELSGAPGGGPTSRLGSSVWSQAILSASRKHREQVAARKAPAEGPGPTEPGPDAVPLPPLPTLPALSDQPGGYIHAVVGLIREAALGLQVVHDQGIVHRDVKPANLMLMPTGGRVVLMDFGLAKGQSLALTRSRQGGFLGTLRYAGPEQLASASLTVGPAADVRGLGVTLWELLTRRRLFAEAQDEAQLALHIHERDVPLLRSVDRGLDRDLEAIVARATERRASERTQTAGELASHLQLYLEGKPLPIRPPGPAERAYRWARAHKALVATASALLVALVATFVTAFVLYRSHKEKEVQAEREASREAQEAAYRANFRNFEDALAAGGWSPQSRDKVEAPLAELTRLRPDQAEVLRKRWHQHVGDLLEKAVRAERLSPAEVRDIGAGLVWLAARDPERAGAVRGELNRRLQEWEQVFNLVPPFSGLSGAFEGRAELAPAAGAVPAALMAVRPTQATSAQFVPTRARCRGDLQFEAAFQAPSWGVAAQVGLGLYDSQGHTGPVLTALCSPDGRWLASSSTDGTVKVWSPARGRLEYTLPLSAARQWSSNAEARRRIAFNRDGTRLATAEPDAVRLRDAATGKALATLKGDYHEVAFSPDGKALVVATFNTATLWDGAPGGRLVALKEEGKFYGRVSGLTFSPDGRFLAAGGFQRASLWEVPSGKLVRTIKTTHPRGTEVFFALGGKVLGTFEGGKAQLTDVRTGRKRASFSVTGKQFSCLAVSPDGTRLAVGDFSGRAQLWDLEAGRLLANLPGHGYRTRALGFSPDGLVLATVGSSGPPRAWASTTGVLKLTIEGLPRAANDLAFTPDGKALVTAGEDGAVRLWDLRDGRPQPPLEASGYTFLVRVPLAGLGKPGERPGTFSASDAVKLAFVADGRRLAAVDPDGKVKTVSVGGPLQERVVSFGPGRDLSLERRHFALSPDGALLAVRAEGPGLQLYDLATGKLRAGLDGHLDRVLDMTFGPDGKELFSVDDGGVVRVWNTVTGKGRASPLPWRPVPVDQAAFTATGRALVTVDRDRRAEVQDVATGKVLASWPAPHPGLERVAVSTDAKLVATVGEPGKGETVKVWDAAAGRERFTLRCRQGLVTTLAFSPDGALLATGGADGSVRLWDTGTGEWQACLEGHVDSIRDLAFSPDGKMLATTGNDPQAWPPVTVRAWRLADCSLGRAVRSGGPLQLQLLRNGVLLQERLVKLPASAAEAPLRLAALLEEDRLTLQLNDLPPVAFQDVFPLRQGSQGQFSVYWPAGVRLEQLRAQRKAPPARASVLERGDEAYAQGRLVEALAHYQEQARKASEARFRQEARCKAALCLLALRRQDQAAELFQQVAAEPGPRWPAVARCQLWLIRLRQKRFKEANAILADMTTNYRFADLAPSVPRAVREEILREYENQGGYSGTTFKSRPVAELQRLLLVQELFDAPRDELARTRTALARVAHEAGDLELGLKTTRALLQEDLSEYRRGHALVEHTWLLLRLKATDQARADLDRYLAQPASDPSYTAVLLLLRATVHAAAGRWADAEKDLPQHYWSAPRDDGAPHAFLLEGLLREQRGARGAADVWRRGFRKLVEAGQLSSVEVVVLGSLSGELNEADARKFIDEAVRTMDHLPALSTLRNGLLGPAELAPVMRAMWSSRRGREHARQMALMEMSAGEMNSLPAVLFLYELVHQGSLPGELSPEHDELLWGLAKEMHGGFSTGKLTVAQVGQIALTWADASGGFSWALLSVQLEAPLRGRVAYVLGHRALFQKKPGPARGYFRTALKDSAPGSALRRLAQTELDRLPAKGRPGAR